MRFLFLAAGLLLPAASLSDVIPIPDPIGKEIAAGRAAATGTRSDIGGPAAAFDGKLDTPFRTPSINPAFLQIAFRQPKEARAFYLRVANLSEFRIACAENPEDMERKNGTYRDLTGLRRTDREGQVIVRLEKPVTARIFRLDTRRLEGDEYVHVFEWQFARLVPPERLRLEAIPTRPEWKPSRVIPSGGVIRLRVVASAQSVDLDVTDRSRLEGKNFRRFADGPRNALQAPRLAPNERRTVRLTARYGKLAAELPIEVEGWSRRPMPPDLDVLFIERTPRIAYDAPDRGNGPGWPAQGQTVRWTAHVRAIGREARNLDYAWYLDDIPVKYGVISRIGADQVKKVSLPWKWDQRRHRLVFALYPEQTALRDEVRANNRREVATNALTVGFWVEEKIADHWRDRQRAQNPDNNSFEDWAQWMVAEWNRLMAEAKHPLSPNGLSDRWRLDRVTIVPSGALPLAGGLPSNNPDNRDRTVDIVWGFPIDSDGKISDYWKPTPTFDSARSTPAFHTDWALLHELSHARYLVDSYGFDVHPDSVRISSLDGRPAIETAEMKAVLPKLNKYKGLMGGGIRPQYDAYTAGALERIRGRRARGGNYNGPTVIGEYIQELPAQNTFTFQGPDGNPLAGAKLSIWQAKPVRTAWYGKLYEGAPDREYTLDSLGSVSLGRNPFGPDPLQHTYGHANTTILMRVIAEGKVYYHFQEVSDFNLEFWKGNRERARYIVRLGGEG